MATNKRSRIKLSPRPEDPIILSCGHARPIQPYDTFGYYMGNCPICKDYRNRKKDWINRAFDAYEGQTNRQVLKDQFRQAILKHLPVGHNTSPSQLQPLDVEKILDEMGFSGTDRMEAKFILSKYGTTQVTREEVEGFARSYKFGWVELYELLCNFLRSKGILKE